MGPGNLPGQPQPQSVCLPTVFPRRLLESFRAHPHWSVVRSLAPQAPHFRIGLPGRCGSASGRMEPLLPGSPEPPPPPAPRRQALATASLVLGVLSILGLGCFAGLPAVLTGHVAYGRARRQPQTHGGRGVAIAGFVLGYVGFLVGLPVLALLLSVAVPRLQEARSRAEAARCRESLIVIAAEARRFAGAHEDRLPATLAELEQVSGRSLDPSCPMARGGPYRPIPFEWAPPKEFVEETGSTAPPVVLVARCPAHGHFVTLQGQVRPGPPGIRRRRSGD